MRDPSLPQPPREQVERAAAFLKSHERAPDWDLAPLTPYLQWCSRQNDPFLDAFVALAESMTPDPLSHLGSPPEELISQARQLAPDAVTRLGALQEASLHELTAAVQGVDPVPLLTAMMFATWVRPWGRYYEPHTVPNGLDIEIVGAIVAAGTVAERRPATAADLRRVMSAAEDMRWAAYSLSEAYSLTQEPTAPAAARKLMLDRWLIMRGTAYPDHARAITRALCGQVKAMASRFGFGYDDLVAFADALVLSRERHVPAATESWTAAVHGGAGHPDGSGADALESFMKHASEHLRHAFCVPIDPAGSPLTTDAAHALRQRIIAEFGMRPGDGPPVRSVFVDPPQRAKPFFILPAPLDVQGQSDGTETALLINPHAFTTEMHLTLEAFLGKRAPNWSVARAKAVDEYALALLQSALPGSTAVRNVFIDTPAGREEVDGVIVFEDVVILIEGKGAPLKLAARRGSSDKLTAQLSELVTYGYGQLERDTRHVLEGRPARFFDRRGTCVLQVDGAGVRRCYQVMPTLDGLSDLGAALPRLIELGVLPQDARPWIVGAADMTVVLDVLTRPAELLGYLEFRDRWAGEPRITTIDELEMLSLFLYQVDLVDRLERAEGGQVMHAPNQHLYDSWYAGHAGHGPVVPKPRIKTSKRVRRFVDELTRTRPDGWLESACAAYQLPASFTHALDAGERALAAHAHASGTFVNLNRDIALLVVADGDTTTNVGSMAKTAGASDGVALVCRVRQRGGHLELDDVRFGGSRAAPDHA